MELIIDPDDLTLGEVEFFEEFSGLTFEQMTAENMNTKAVIAMVTIQERRKNPDFTPDDARKVKVGSLEESEDPPTPAAPAAS